MVLTQVTYSLLISMRPFTKRAQAITQVDTDHKCHAVARKTVGEQFGECAVSIGYMAITALRVCQTSDTVS